MSTHPYRDNIQQLIRDAQEQGWRHERTSLNHHKFLAPNGKDICVTSGTPSDVRSVDNFIADMRRAGFQLPSERFKAPVIAEAFDDAMVRIAAVPPPSQPNQRLFPRNAVKNAMDAYFARHDGQRVHRGDLFAALRSQLIGVNEETLNSSLGRMVMRGDLVKCGRGEYIYHAPGKAAPDVRAPYGSQQAAPTPPPPPPLATVPTELTSDDERELDEALVALSRIEGVVRKYRAVIKQFAALKKLMNGEGGVA